MILSKDTILAMLRSTPPLVENIRDTDVQIQVTGIDLTVGELFTIKNTGRLDFTNKTRTLPARSLVRAPVFAIVNPATEPLAAHAGLYRLDHGNYILRLHEKVSLPNDVTAMAHPRSSLTRCGATISSGFWDAGYSGHGEVLLTVGEKGLILTPDARICQMSFIKADGVTEGYSGVYQEARGDDERSESQKKGRGKR